MNELENKLKILSIKADRFKGRTDSSTTPIRVSIYARSYIVGPFTRRSVDFARTSFANSRALQCGSHAAHRLCVVSVCNTHSVYDFSLVENCVRGSTIGERTTDHHSSGAWWASPLTAKPLNMQLSDRSIRYHCHSRQSRRQLLSDRIELLILLKPRVIKTLFCRTPSDSSSSTNSLIG